MAAARKLTPKQAAFAANFIRTGQVSQSYRDAYGWGGSDKALSVQAARLLALPRVSLEIDRLRLAAQARSEITIERVMREYARLAFLDPEQFFDPVTGNLRAINAIPEDARRAIAGMDVEEATETHGKMRKIRLSDKRAALDSLAKILGMFQEPASASSGSVFVVQVRPAGWEDRPRGEVLDVQPEAEPVVPVKAVVRRI